MPKSEKPKMSIPDLIRIEGIDSKGFGIIAKLVMTDTDLHIGAKALYSYLCSYAGNGTTAYPGRSKILADLKICKDAYYHYQKDLINNGYIRIEKNEEYPFNNTYVLVSRPEKLQEMQELPADGKDKLIAKGIKALGYGTVPKAAMLDSRLSVHAKALYAYFCSFSGSGTTAFPKRETILYHLQISINPYQKYIRQLIMYNYIEVKQQTENGRFANNIYYLNDFPDEEVGQQEIERRAANRKNIENTNANSDAEYSAENVTAPADEEYPMAETEEITPAEDVSSGDNLLTERNTYAQIIKDNIEYDILEERGKESSSFQNLLDIIFEIMLDTVTLPCATIRIGGKDYPYEVVKSKLLKLEYENIEYAIDNLLSVKTEIKNIRQYILTTLYNSNTHNFYWDNQFNHNEN